MSTIEFSGHFDGSMAVLSDGLPRGIDLQTHEFDKYIFDGNIRLVALYAREILKDMTHRQIMETLETADLILYCLIESGMKINADKPDEQTLSYDLLKKMHEIECVRLVSPYLAKLDIHLQESAKSVQISPAILFSAYAIKTAAIAEQIDSDIVLSTSGGAYAIHASIAAGVATALNGGQSGEYDYIIRTQRARAGGLTKARNSAKALAKAEIHHLYNDWMSGKTLHKSGAAFARYAMDNVSGIDNIKSVEKWIREWREKAK